MAVLVDLLTESGCKTSGDTSNKKQDLKKDETLAEISKISELDHSLGWAEEQRKMIKQTKNRAFSPKCSKP